jgi:hypothetical protein
MGFDDDIKVDLNLCVVSEHPVLILILVSLYFVHQHVTHIVHHAPSSISHFYKYEYITLLHVSIIVAIFRHS